MQTDSIYTIPGLLAPLAPHDAMAWAAPAAAGPAATLQQITAALWIGIPDDVMAKRARLGLAAEFVSAVRAGLYGLDANENPFAEQVAGPRWETFRAIGQAVRRVILDPALGTAIPATVDSGMWTLACPQTRMRKWPILPLFASVAPGAVHFSVWHAWYGVPDGVALAGHRAGFLADRFAQVAPAGTAADRLFRAGWDEGAWLRSTITGADQIVTVAHTVTGIRLARRLAAAAGMGRPGARALAARLALDGLSRGDTERAWDLVPD